MRSVALILFSIAASSGEIADAQSGAGARDDASSSQERPEEIIVRGRRLGELRLQVQEAREQAYAIFNEINSDDDFDVHCREERRYFSHSKRRVCRAQFESRIAADAGAEYMNTLKMVCPPSAGPANIQDCIFSGHGQRAADAARTVEAGLPIKRDQMTDEIVRLANENDEFAQAILDFYEAGQRYDAARKGRDD